VSVVDRGGKDSRKFVTGGQTTLQSARNVRVANNMREAPAGGPHGIQLRFVRITGKGRGRAESVNMKLSLASSPEEMASLIALEKPSF